MKFVATDIMLTVARGIPGFTEGIVTNILVKKGSRNTAGIIIYSVKKYYSIFPKA